MYCKKIIFDSEPPLAVNEGGVVRINFDVEETEVSVGRTDGNEDGESLAKRAFAAYVVRVPRPLERDRVVDAIVSAAYPADRMQAVVNNHLLNLAAIADGGELDADGLEHEAEYKAMQEWRVKAKAVAKEVTAEAIV